MVICWLPDGPNLEEMEICFTYLQQAASWEFQVLCPDEYILGPPPTPPA